MLLLVPNFQAKRIKSKEQETMFTKQSKSKQVSIMAMTAALFAIFFYLSKLVALPTFTFLYLPIILLGIFPSGLAGVV